MGEDDKPLKDYLDLLLPDKQQRAVDIARKQLSDLGVDTSDMSDRTMITHLVVLQEIAGNKGIIIDDALTQYAHKFPDLGALTTALLTPDEETRH